MWGQVKRRWSWVIVCFWVGDQETSDLCLFLPLGAGTDDPWHAADASGNRAGLPTSTGWELGNGLPILAHSYFDGTGRVGLLNLLGR